MQAFYERVLGFATHSHASLESDTHDPAGEPTILFMNICEVNSRLGRNNHPQMLVLIDYQRHASARQRFVGHDVSRSTLNHLAFEINLDKYDAHKRHLESCGLEVTETTFDSMNARALFFTDPEGNTLELICHDPDVG